MFCVIITSTPVDHYDCLLGETSCVQGKLFNDSHPCFVSCDQRYVSFVTPCSNTFTIVLSLKILFFDDQIGLRFQLQVGGHGTPWCRTVGVGRQGCRDSTSSRWMTHRSDRMSSRLKGLSATVDRLLRMGEVSL